MVTKRETSKIKSDNKKPSNSPEKKPKKNKSKGGGFFSFMFKLVIIIVLIGVGYYGYVAYNAYQKSGGNKDKAWDEVKGNATKDFNAAKQNTTMYGTMAYNNAAVWSANAYENSEEYLTTVKEFTAESFNELSEKVKKFGEKTPDELSSSADGYLKEFMSGKELPPAKVKEEVAYVPKKNEPNETVKDMGKKPETSEPIKTEKKSTDPVKDSGFVTPEKTKEEPVTQEIKKGTPKVEEPKKKGFTKVSEEVGPKNEAAITKSKEETKTQEIKKSTDPVNEPPHIKTYKEGRGYFLQALDHYKKQMPGQPNEKIHRRQAYALFKKAGICFDKINAKMAGDPEYDRISVDNHRFMYGCGKSMTIDH